MTIRAIVGLAGLNVFFALVGAGILWGLRGWRAWTDLVRLAGAAYCLGVAGMTTVLTLELVAGIPFGGPTIVLSGMALVATGLLAGWRGRRVRPLLRPLGWRLPRLTIFGGLWVAAIVLYLEALFRSGRLAPMSEWDAWRCWTLRADAIFYFDGLDREAFGSAACPGYPPGFSALEASGFHAMGSPDVVTLHLQYWFLAAGFVAAVAGLLASRVRQTILLPFLLLALVLPSVTDRVTDGRADLPLAYLTALGAILVLLWLEDRQTWRLPAATLLFAGGVLTKREGLLLVAFVFLAALAASWREPRSAWPRLVAAALAAVAISVPWRIWLETEDIRSGAPPDGYLGLLDHADRARPALWLVVRTFLDYDLWLLATPLALTAVALAFLAGARRHAVFVLVFIVVSVLGCAWAIWSEPVLEITDDYGLNPVVRLVGGPTIVLVALTPLLLERAHACVRERRQSMSSSLFWRAAGTGRAGALPWVILLVALVGYPLSMLAGYSGLRLPGALPRFPSPDECITAPVDGEKVRVVLGYTDSYPDAMGLQERARSAGLANSVVARDGCGRLRVFLDDVPSQAAGEEIAQDAAARGLRPTLEHDPDA